MGKIVFEMAADHTCGWLSYKKGFFAVFHVDNNVLSTLGGAVRIVTYCMCCTFWKNHKVA